MSDRVLLNQIRKNNNQIINPVSNAFIYAQLSGGILTLLLFLRFLVSNQNEYFKCV